MRLVWLYIFPLLFLPETLLSYETAYGTYSMADFVIGFYLGAVLLARQQQAKPDRQNYQMVSWIFTLFVWWAILTTILLPFRYDYGTNQVMYFGLLKIAKFALYGLAAFLTVRLLVVNDYRHKLRWSLLAGGIIIAASLLATRPDSPFYTGSSSFLLLEIDYKDNPLSVTMSILLTFLTGIWIHERQATGQWNKLMGMGLGLILGGIILATGRGGWIGLIVGTSYLLFQHGFKRAVFVLLLMTAVFTYAYNYIPSFQLEVDKTLYPDEVFMQRYNVGVMGIDEGRRWDIFQNQLPRVLDDPVFGRGFFHRGGLSGIFSTGSHIFYLQIVLETRIVGGVLLLLICWHMWRQAKRPGVSRSDKEWPVKGALLAAFVGGLSGEYFYGGVTLFTVLIIYGIVGSQPSLSKTSTYTNRPINFKDGLPESKWLNGKELIR